jgi:hypothetical protein
MSEHNTPRVRPPRISRCEFAPASGPRYRLHHRCLADPPGEWLATSEADAIERYLTLTCQADDGGWEALAIDSDDTPEHWRDLYAT